LEISTGVGSATNDLLVRIGENYYAIEVKEFYAAAPMAKLRSEIADKVKKLPAIPKVPVVFHVVLAEQDGTKVRQETAFIEAVQAYVNEMPALISAIVVGRRFVDSSGGPIKRETKAICMNPRLTCGDIHEDLVTIFKNNFHEVIYPEFGVSSFIEWQHQVGAQQLGVTVSSLNTPPARA
jgi:hypothetical protein